MRAILFVLFSAGCTGVIGDGASKSNGACNAEGAKVDLRRLTPLQYQRAIADVFGGSVAPSPRYPGANGKSVTGFSTEPDLNAVSAQGVENLLYASEDVAESFANALPSLLPCSQSSADEGCIGKLLDVFGRRAYRRTLTQPERDALLGAYRGGVQSGASFTEAAAMVVDQMLQSPQFLYLIEDAAPTVRKLSGTEIASRLSFALLDTIPDDALLDAAEHGGLQSEDDIVAQAKRLLASPKADTTLARFFREWSGTKKVSPADKLQVTFPNFDQKHADSMNASFDRFVVGVVRDGGNLRAILRSSDAWVDANMASFFGVDAPKSDGFVKVSLDPNRYSGILTQPALLASLAHSSDTSYVFRGRFVQKQLLCTTIGTPPADAQAQFQKIMLPPNPTAKDVSQSVQMRNPCGGCHSIIDPAGLALEHFDALGQFRDRYATGQTIDVTGTLTNVSGLAFDGPVDMMEKLSKQPAVMQCFAKQVFRFGISRMDDTADACAVKSIEDALASSNGRIDEALFALVRSDAFLRKVDP